MPSDLAVVPQLQRIAAGYGLNTDFAVMLPPGSKVAAFVRSTGAQSGDDAVLTGKLALTLAAGLARCRSGLGDTVIVMPGHSESVVDATMLTNLVAGTRIVGLGRGSAMPVFRWTTSITANWAISVADVQISGLLLRLEGVNTVTKGITITGANCLISGCDIEVASGASNICAICVEVGTGATRCEIVGNRFRGSVGNAVTDGVKIVGTAVEGVRVTDNVMIFAATSANGQIHVTSAATQLEIARNRMYNTVASGQFNVRTDAVACDGMIYDNYGGCLIGAGTAPSADFISVGAGTLCVAFNNLAVGVTVATGSAALAPAVDT